jgi:TonB family protein
MFDKSYTWSRFREPKPKTIRVHLGHVPTLDLDPKEDKKGFRIAVGVALALHILLFVIYMPDLGSEIHYVGTERQVYVVQQVRFTPPPPQQQQQLPKRPEKTRKIPIPDPTPDEPEPIRVEEIDVPDTDIDSEIDEAFGIPQGPPAFGISGPGPFRVGGDVLPPKKIFAPQPRYTEDARQGRIQGVVLLEAVIDVDGSVVNVRVLKGLPQGLTESAAETAKSWKFEPATRNGQPVAVYLNLTVRFSLQ